MRAGGRLARTSEQGGVVMVVVRVAAVGVLVAAVALLGSGPVSASPHAGGSCRKVGATATAGGVKLVCKKKANGALVWKAKSGGSSSAGTSSGGAINYG